MTKYLVIVLIFVPFFQAKSEDSQIKNDNTIQVLLDDFETSVEYPRISKNSKELTLIIRNRSKVHFLFSLKKNNLNQDYISLPSLENHTRTISIGHNENYALRSLSPPAEDIKLNTSLK